MWKYYLRLACISIGKNPVLSVLMILAVAVGIATCLTTLTMYSVVSGNPVEHKNQTLFAVQLDSWGPEREYFDFNRLPPQLTYRDAIAILQSSIPDQTVVMQKTGMTVESADMSGESTIEKARMTTRDFFSMFDVDFIYGGPWSEKADLNADNIVVVNETINNKYFNGSNSVGNTILLEGETYRVTGVVADSWRLIPKVYDLNNGAYDSSASLYVPFLNVAERRYEGWGNHQAWSHQSILTYEDFLQSETIWLQVWVQLKTTEQIQAFSQYLENYILQQKEHDRFQRPLKYQLNTSEQWLKIFNVVSNDDRVLVALSLVFLAVCLVNTIVMLLAKFLRKAPEAGIRRALGASRQAIFLQYLFEAMVIGFAGAVVGLALSWLGLAGVRGLYADYSHVAVMQSNTVLMALLLAMLAAIGSGVFPAWRISHSQPATYLKSQ